MLNRCMHEWTVYLISCYMTGYSNIDFPWSFKFMVLNCHFYKLHLHITGKSTCAVLQGSFTKISINPVSFISYTDINWNWMTIKIFLHVNAFCKINTQTSNCKIIYSIVYNNIVIIIIIYNYNYYYYYYY